MNRIVLNCPDEIGEWVCRQSGGTWQKGRGQAFGVVDEELNIIAGVIFDSWNGASLCMHVAALPGKSWISRALLSVCFTYAFDQCRVNKILGLVGSGNTAARRLDEHLGFELEATLKGAHPSGDLLVYSMTRDQCRWLKLFKENRNEQAEGAACT